jgi:hypothetical protein
MEISLFIRFVVFVAVVISIVDILGFYTIRRYGIRVTWLIVLLLIIAKIVPILMSLWYWLVFK